MNQVEDSAGFSRNNFRRAALHVTRQNSAQEHATVDSRKEHHENACSSSGQDRRLDIVERSLLAVR